MGTRRHKWGRGARRANSVESDTEEDTEWRGEQYEKISLRKTARGKPPEENSERWSDTPVCASYRQCWITTRCKPTAGTL